MTRQVHLFDRPDRFVTGTVGQPGERTFFLQASHGGRTVSVSLEKAQVTVLADRMDELLTEVAQRSQGEDEQAAARSREPAVRAVLAALSGNPDDVAAVDDVDPLTAPVEEEFRVGAMGLAWDSDGDAVVVEAVAGGEEPVDEDAILSDTDDGPDALRVRISPVAARAFIARARRVIAAGRPACPLCALPLDPSGHVCPRQNGYRR
ncbi:MAG: DUF3090 family protein [Geodermatophilaceae bacterium]|nr:DUF3090 family protein [Geodermatophilaceae bacterium]